MTTRNDKDSNSGRWPFRDLSMDGETTVTMNQRMIGQLLQREVQAANLPAWQSRRLAVWRCGRLAVCTLPWHFVPGCQPPTCQPGSQTWQSGRLAIWEAGSPAVWQTGTAMAVCLAAWQSRRLPVWLWGRPAA